MPSDLQVSNIKDLTGSNTGLSIASDGQVTISQNNPTVTLGSNTTFPKGVSSSVNYLLWRQTSGSTGYQGALGGTGEQIVYFGDIKNGTEDGAFTQNILSLNSSNWTMNTGYYIWDFHRAMYWCSHVFVLGIRTYGDSSGSGSTLGNVTTANVNFGSNLSYMSSDDGHLTHSSGTLKVTSTSQKYGFYVYLQANNQAGYTIYTHDTSTHALVRNMLRFIKIGEV